MRATAAGASISGNCYGSNMPNMPPFEFCVVATQDRQCCVQPSGTNDVYCFATADAAECYDGDILLSLNGPRRHCGFYPVLRAVLSEIGKHLATAGADENALQNLGELTIPAIEDNDNWVVQILRLMVTRHAQLFGADGNQPSSQFVARLSFGGRRRRRNNARLIEAGCELADVNVAGADEDMEIILAPAAGHAIDVFMCPCGVDLPESSVDFEYVAHSTCVQGLAVGGGGDDAGGDDAGDAGGGGDDADNADDGGADDAGGDAGDAGDDAGDAGDAGGGGDDADDGGADDAGGDAGGGNTGGSSGGGSSGDGDGGGGSRPWRRRGCRDSCWRSCWCSSAWLWDPVAWASGLYWRSHL